MPKALDENVTKLNIPHSVQSSPSLLGKQFLEVSRFIALLREPERRESRQHQASSGSLCLSRSSRGERVCFRPTSKFWVHSFLTSCSFTKQVLAQVVEVLLARTRKIPCASSSSANFSSCEKVVAMTSNSQWRVPSKR